MKHIAQGGSLAEEVISTIRTAQAFGSQKTLSGLYDGHVDQAHKVDLKAAIGHGAALSVFFFVIYAGYALSGSNPLGTIQNLTLLLQPFRLEQRS